MALLRAFKYIFITTVHPVMGFGLIEDDQNRRLTVRFAFWIPLLIYFILFYVLIKNAGTTEDFPVALNVLAFIGLKMGGIGLFFFVAAITGLILKFDGSPGQLLTPILGLTVFPEFVLLILTFYFPLHYQEIRFLIYVWRITLIILGVIVIDGVDVKRASIFGIICGLILYFANFNFFDSNDLANA